jgi:hypothetical protein
MARELSVRLMIVTVSRRRFYCISSQPSTPPFLKDVRLQPAGTPVPVTDYICARPRTPMCGGVPDSAAFGTHR